MCLTANQMMYISAHKIEPTKNFLLDHELTKIRLNLFQKLKNIEMVLVKVDPLKFCATKFENNHTLRFNVYLENVKLCGTLRVYLLPFFNSNKKRDSK